MPRRRINVTIAKQGELTATRSYTFPWYAAKVAIAIGIVVALVILSIIGLLIYYYFEARQITALRSELQDAKASMNKVDALQRELAYHREFTGRVAGLLGISVPTFSESDTLAIADESGINLDADSGLAGDTSDDGSFYTPSGRLVNETPPDPRNRPRGLPLRGPISRSFTPAPSNPALRHTGLDLAIREGTPVLATADGTVEYSGEHDIYGFLIIIDHGNGYKTTYGHNSVLLARSGEQVRRGDRIALSGNTGVSSAPHLHYEVSENGEPVDPAGFLGN